MNESLESLLQFVRVCNKFERNRNMSCQSRLYHNSSFLNARLCLILVKNNFILHYSDLGFSRREFARLVKCLLPLIISTTPIAARYLIVKNML